MNEHRPDGPDHDPAGSDSGSGREPDSILNAEDRPATDQSAVEAASVDGAAASSSDSASDGDTGNT